MKPYFWRRWCDSLCTAWPTGPASRTRPRLRLQSLEDRVTPTLDPRMVLDINATTLSSWPREMVAIGSTTYFTADDGVNGSELWKTDGTVAGTVMVKDIFPGNFVSRYSYFPNSSDPGYLTNVNGTLFFTARDGPNGRELWKTDGTADGTVLVKDINAGAGGSDCHDLTNVNGTLFFAA